MVVLGFGRHLEEPLPTTPITGREPDVILASLRCGGIEGGNLLVELDTAAEDAHHFAWILGGLWLAPFADFGIAEAIEGVNGVIDACGRTDD